MTGPAGPWTVRTWLSAATGAALGSAAGVGLGLLAVTGHWWQAIVLAVVGTLVCVGAYIWTGL